MASPTVLIFSVSSSGISILNCSSSASTSSTTSSDSAFRSSENEASSLTLSGATSSCSMMIFLTFSSISSAMGLGPLSSCYSLAARTLHEKSTVDAQDLPRHVPGGGPRQIDHGGGDVLGFSDAAERNRLEQLGAPRFGKLGRGHVGVDVARRNGVHGDAPRRVLPPERLRHTDDPGLGGDV